MFVFESRFLFLCFLVFILDSGAFCRTQIENLEVVVLRSLMQQVVAPVVLQVALLTNKKLTVIASEAWLVKSFAVSASMLAFSFIFIHQVRYICVFVFAETTAAELSFPLVAFILSSLFKSIFCGSLNSWSEELDRDDLSVDALGGRIEERLNEFYLVERCYLRRGQVVICLDLV